MSKWIELETDASTGKPYLWKCDECGEEVETRWNYCPECGDPKTNKGKSINTLVKTLETEHRKLREIQSATDKNVGTTISRQQAIDAVTDELDMIDHVPKWVFDRLEKRLKQLPPAQPEQHIDADGTLWITVPDFKQVKRVIVDEEKSKFCRQFYMDAQPEQRTGYWYPVGVAEAVGGESAQWGSAIAYHKCSECDGQALGDDFEQEVLSKWCPHCGAKMEGDAE